MRALEQHELIEIGGGNDILFDLSQGECEMDLMVKANLERFLAETKMDPIRLNDPLFSMGNFEVTTSGSFTGGLKTAAIDCAAGAGVSKLGLDFASAAGFLTSVKSNAAAVVGCTTGVGLGIIRDW